MSELKNPVTAPSSAPRIPPSAYPAIAALIVSNAVMMIVSGTNSLPTTPLTFLMIFKRPLKYLAIPETVSPNPRTFLTILNIVLPASTNGLTMYMMPFLIVSNGPSSPSTAVFTLFIMFLVAVPKSLITFMIDDPTPSIASRIFFGVKNLIALIQPLNMPIRPPMAPAPRVASNPIFAGPPPVLLSAGLGPSPAPPPAPPWLFNPANAASLSASSMKSSRTDVCPIITPTSSSITS